MLKSTLSLAKNNNKLNLALIRAFSTQGVTPKPIERKLWRNALDVSTNSEINTLGCS
jgi:hypothetical protein